LTQTFSQIATIIRATILQQQGDAMIDQILLDSRKLLFPDSSLFFALDGPRRNGSSFIPELYKKGLRHFVVDENFTTENIQEFPEAGFLQVADVLQALHLLAAWHRARFSYPVIGITGSNGKTIVKEWLFQLLQSDFQIVRSPKSYNSQIGVPLSIWQMNERHNLAIFEAGISQPDEMQQLEKMISPSIGVFTSIGEAHGAGFLNIRQKINEKLRLFVHADALVYPADDPDINDAVNQFKNNVRAGDEFQLISWGRKEGLSLQIVSIENKTAGKHIRAIWKDIAFEFSIPFMDEASLENAITCSAVLLQLGIQPSGIHEKMQLLRPVEMRLELKQGINNCSVINDSYSADINSLTIALDFLLQQQQHQKRTLILSDILQSGKTDHELYAEVATILAQKQINRFIGIGPGISRCREVFSGIAETVFYNSTAEFKQQFHAQHFQQETILLKGARVFAFEQISQLLEQKLHQTVMEINLNAITHNLGVYQQRLNAGTKLMAMVKAFSYGSGSFEIANLLQFHKVDYLTVAYTDEGVELRKAGISLPIMVMNTDESSFESMVQHQLEPELFSFDMLNGFENYLKRSGIEQYPVHIKLDTGMHRLGFEEKDIESLCSILQRSACFKIQSVFSHLAASDAPVHDDFTGQQSAVFEKCCRQLQTTIQYPFLRHIANTAAIHRHPELQYDMVRLGIGLYGVDNHAGMQEQLKNVTTLKTTISQIKQVRAGETVGYNREGIAKKDTVIATVGIGYADGYPRALSNGAGKMLVNGILAPVIGTVCMDMTMLDITDIPAAAGDEVIVFGEALSVKQVAAWANTIAYEILTGISQRVKRVYFEE